jgi:limonene-1,2-epoxide hydrolase
MKPRELVRMWVKKFNSADVDGLASLYHEDAINHQVANEPVEGKEAIREMFAKQFALADMHCIVENIFEDGAWAILEWKDPLGLRGCGFFYVTEGKIKFQRGYWDKLSFLRLNHLPIPGLRRACRSWPTNALVSPSRAQMYSLMP